MSDVEGSLEDALALAVQHRDWDACKAIDAERDRRSETVQEREL